VSLIAVLIPLLFMGDVVGRLFHEFAITLAVTIVISAVVSLTLVPMMCAKLLRHRPPEAESGHRTLGAMSDFEALIAATAGAQMGARPPAADHAGGDCDPRADRRAVRDHPEGLLPGAGHRRDPGASPRPAQSVSYAGMAQRQEALAAAILKDPDVVSLSSFIGVDGSNTRSTAAAF
jgi:multidrug efflux pump